MSIQVKRRREAATFLSTYTGAQGELIVDTTNNRVQVHDGATPGGFPAAKVSEVASLAPVQSVAGRTGAITLAVADVAGAAPLASPALTGAPTAPNAAPGTNSAQLATTSFVAASFVTYAYAGATYATAANATLTGTPTAPTQSAGDNSTRLATTAYADRATSANFARTQINDAAYSVLASDRTIAVIALTAARTISLPRASAYALGATLTIVDESGACSATNALTIGATGTDTINGAASTLLSSAYGYVALESNGLNKWTIIDSNPPNLSGYMGRNLLINGNFAINQRGYASGAVLGSRAYGHDRWTNWYVTTPYTFTQTAPDTTITLATGGQIGQVVEGVPPAGTYTLSWSGTAKAIVLYTVGGSSTNVVYQLPSPATFSLPANIDANSLSVILQSLGASLTVGKVQLEAGPVATPFERRPLGVELALCQRYFATSYVGVAAGSLSTVNQLYFVSQTAGSYLAVGPLKLPTTMRATPTITLYSPATGASGYLRVQSPSGDVPAVVGTSGPDYYLAQINNTNVNPGGISFHYTASAEF